MRPAAVAGQFYPSTAEGLDTLIRDLFLHPLGPGKLPTLVSDGARKIEGGIVPHAGYIYSGPVAAHFYHDLALDGYPDVFVILGPNHYGMGSGIATTLDDFLTPYGVARIDKELAKSIAREIIDIDPIAHRYEHSIEVQIPFLQFFRREIKIVPISMLMQEKEAAIEVGKIIREEVENLGRDAVIIASSDFSHYVPKNIAYNRDSLVIEKIIKRDVDSLYKVIYKHNITMCGYGPITAMLTATKGKVELLKYATSGDVQPMSEVVGYASFKVVKV